MMNVPNKNKEKWILTYFLVAIFLLIVLDVTYDLLAGDDFSIEDLFFEFAVEGTILALVLGSVHYVWKMLQNERDTRFQVEANLIKTSELAKKWEKKSLEFVKEFQRLLLVQFDEWGLSKSEKEVAILLLQGLNSKEISKIRFVSEKTIRNQCHAIYSKAGVAGKVELVTFFVKELLQDVNNQ